MLTDVVGKRFQHIIKTSSTFDSAKLQGPDIQSQAAAAAVTMDTAMDTDMATSLKDKCAGAEGARAEHHS